MNNYLTQIIATNQGAANVIQPRLPSLFEPIVPELPPTIAMDQPQAQWPTLSRAQPNVHKIFNDPIDAKSKVILRSDSPTIEELSQVEDRTMPLTVPPPIEHDEIESPAIIRPPIRPYVIEPQSLLVDHPMTPPNPIEPQREIVSMVQPVAPNASRESSRIIVRPNITLNDHSQIGEPQSHTPIIRVTIGRIEVRANMPAPTQPARVALRTPKLSLDDYLKSQQRGER